jgi:hypothetical protein
MDGCVAARGSACLAKAFRDRPRPQIDNPRREVSGELFYDLRTAMAMLAVPSAADALSRDYGIDSKAYLGTGFSVPVTKTGVASYWQALQNEYFLPNLCAQAIDPATCPVADPDVWTLRLNAGELMAALDRPVESILTNDAKAFIARTGTGSRADGLPKVFVRFTPLRASFYKGTVGRPGLVRVFFADYTQVRAKPLREVLIATGASALIGDPDPSQDFFVWIYAPVGATKAVAASWHALFDALQAE